jgi:glucose-1-phosphate thymidylyltransferase
MAGGLGTRLYPLTLGVNKQLLPVYDKPMVYFPIATLMAAGIREILIIANPGDLDTFARLLGDGSQLGVNFSYKPQHEPKGIAQAFIIGDEFIGEENVALILGDNVFYGSGLGRHLETYTTCIGANIFAYRVSNPSDYGIIQFDESLKILSIEEKPRVPKSNFAIPGLYFFDASVTNVVKSVSESSRGELEIVSLLKEFLAVGNLSVTVLPRGTAWLDTGSVQALNDAGNFVRIIEERQGYKIACLEEISWRMGWITDSDLSQIAGRHASSAYGEYLISLINQSIGKEW